MILLNRKIMTPVVLLVLTGYTLFMLSHIGTIPSVSAVPPQSSLWKSASLTSPPRIAYVFAGSPRSFYCPKVHWSIKDYLIKGLSGDPYVFVRASGNDNHNTQTAEGSNRPLPYTQEEIERLVGLVLRPTAISWVQLGSPEEEEEMSRQFSSERHAFYR